MSYIGVPPFGQTVRTITELTASAGQTTFNVSGGYLPGYVDVFLNGVSLASGDFTSTNGSTVVLGAAASLNDEFKAIAYWPVSLTDTYRKGEVDALLATKQAASPTLTTYASTGIGFRNRIINGDMRIDQRNAGASVTITTASPYTLDRWQAYASQNSKYSVQQNAGSVTPPSGFTYYLGATSLSAYSVTSTDIFTIRQIVEGYNIADLNWGTANAKPIVISFWVYSSLTGTFGGAACNNGQTRSYPFTYTISSANTWEFKTVSIAGDTSGTWNTGNGRGIDLFLSIGVGSTYTGTAGAWAGTAYYNATGATSVVGTSGATFYITGVQLEAGDTATSFDRRPYGTELALCQRYYEFAANNNAIGARNISTATTTMSFCYMWKVTKRATPTVTVGYGAINTASVDGVTSFQGSIPAGDWYYPSGIYATAEL